MKLIAKKPCSFGGMQFYIGDEIPADLVADVSMQEKMGIITIANDTEGGSGRESETFYTVEQVEKMVAEAVDEAVNNTVMEMEQKQKELQQVTAELKEMEPDLYQGIVRISVKSASNGGNEQIMAVLANPDEIEQVFSIMQMNAEEGAKAIAEIQSENVLILLHAADSRKTIKDAAKKQADKVLQTEGGSSESGGDNEPAGSHAEGVDT